MDLRNRLPAPTALACLAMLALLAWAPSAFAAGPQFRGVAVHSLWGDAESETIARELDLAVESGSNVVRVDISWSKLEPDGKGQRSSFYAGKVDEFMNAASARGLKVIAMLWSTPCWASSAPPHVKQGCVGEWWDRGVQYWAPQDAQDYATIARWVTERYGGGLAALEVWNEPNLDYYWNASNPPQAYTALVKAAYPAAKAGNAGVPVVAGSLSGADRPFLEALYAHGMRGHYDGLAIHPYSEWRAPTDPWVPEWQRNTFLPGLESIREAQAAVGDATPLWLTEFGWSTGNGAYEHGGEKITVSEQTQASYIACAYQLMSRMDYVRAGIAYALRDQGTNPNSYIENFGIVRRDFSKKPAFDAVREGAPAHCPDFPESGADGSERAKILLTKAPRKTRPGRKVRVAGEVRPPELGVGRRVEIEYRKGGRRWRHGVRTSIEPDGSFTTRMKVKARGRARRIRLRAKMPRVGRSNSVPVKLRGSRSR